MQLQSANFHPLGDCFTVSGPVPGKKCAFPFKFKGVFYRQCTTVDHQDDKLWCSTETDQNDNYIDGQWGNCGLCDLGKIYL